MSARCSAASAVTSRMTPLRQSTTVPNTSNSSALTGSTAASLPASPRPGGHGSTTIFPVPASGPKSSDGKNGPVRGPGPDVRSGHERYGGVQGTHHYRAGQRELGLGGG